MVIEGPLLIAFVFGFASLFIVTVTAFPKISIVFLILRNALGLQQAPANSVVFALAFVLSIYVTLPLLNQMYTVVTASGIPLERAEEVLIAADVAQDPLKQFLIRNTGDKYVVMVEEIAADIWAQSGLDPSRENIAILVPAFMISEITKAFQIGFLLFLPFLAIDLVVTTILMALGMMMVQPTIISIPFKLLLFVMVDGWSLLFRGLTSGYMG